MDFDGLVWRYVPRNAQALHIGSILLARGRWNRYAAYGCLYTSLSPEGARAECAKELRRIGIDAEADEPKDLVSLTVGVARVLDLTDASASALRHHVHYVDRRRRGRFRECRTVADIARLEGYDAILSPSAALDVGRNLNLYIDGRADHLRLMDGPDRIPLNYEP